MTKCECLPGCPFFNDKMDIEQGIGLIYKNKYCLGDNSKCARYMVFKVKGKSFVPPTLYPNMVDAANRIISEK